MTLKSETRSLPFEGETKWHDLSDRCDTQIRGSESESNSIKFNPYYGSGYSKSQLMYMERMGTKINNNVTVNQNQCHSFGSGPGAWSSELGQNTVSTFGKKGQVTPQNNLVTCSNQIHSNSKGKKKGSSGN